MMTHKQALLQVPGVANLSDKQVQALSAWMQWYSARLDRINKDSGEDYTGYEQDLFEAFGCIGVDEL